MPVASEGTFGYRNEGGCDGQQGQPKYSRRCSRFLRLSGPDQLEGLILGMVRIWTFSWECEDKDGKH